MNYKFFFYRMKDILMNPVKTWEDIDSENRSVKSLRNNFFLPLIILVSVSAFVGSLIFVNKQLTPVYSIFVGIKCFGLFYFTVYAAALIFGEITYPLDLGKDFSVSFRIIVYSTVPFFMCQIFSRLFESLLFANILGLYGLYIFWTGAEKMLTPPEYKKMPMLISASIAVAGIYIATNLLLTKLIDKVYFSYIA
jgi:hypothetical protein